MSCFCRGQGDDDNRWYSRSHAGQRGIEEMGTQKVFRQSTTSS